MRHDHNGRSTSTATVDSSGVELPKLKPAEFEQIRSLAKERFGLDLRPGKEDLVTARLARGMRSGRFRSFREYLEHIRADSTGESLTALINALTTNHTSFYREPQHFEFLTRQVLPSLAWESDIRIWSAACSTGEEPYSILCSAAQLWNGDIRRLRVFATDISTRVLDIAKAGVYPEASLANVPPAWRSCFQSTPARDGNVRFKAELARSIEFRRLNLVEPFPFAGKFRVIFCRNVMIYFDKPTQERLVQKLTTHLEPGGYLFVGHSESLAGVQHSLDYLRPAVYRNGSGPR